MNQYTNYNEPFPESWDPEAVIACVSYQNRTLTLHSTARGIDEFTFDENTGPFITEIDQI